MANPLLKMTLMLLSLFSAALVGHGLMDAEHSSHSYATKNAPNQVTAQTTTDTDFYYEPVTLLGETKSLHFNSFSAPSSVIHSHLEAHDQQGKNATPTEATQIQQRGKNNQRSFSFHYLDILEWMFASRGEKAKRHQLHRPSTLHTW